MSTHVTFMAGYPLVDVAVHLLYRLTPPYHSVPGVDKP